VWNNLHITADIEFRPTMTHVVISLRGQLDIQRQALRHDRKVFNRITSRKCLGSWFLVRETKIFYQILILWCWASLSLYMNICKLIRYSIHNVLKLINKCTQNTLQQDTKYSRSKYSRISLLYLVAQATSAEGTHSHICRSY
jgi:hypothetical protein